MKDYYQLIPGDDKYYTLIPSESSDLDLIPTDEPHYILVPAHPQPDSRFSTLKAIFQRAISPKGEHGVRITELCQKLQQVMNLWIS